MQKSTIITNNKNIRTIYRIRHTLNKGFTLVELLIYMALMSILLLVLSALFTSIIDVQLESEATSYAEQDGRFILARLAHDINSASAIVTPSLGQQGNSLQIIRNGINYSYTLDGSNNLVVTSNIGTNKLNSSETSISTISFTQIGNVGGKNTIQIQYSVESETVQNGDPEVRTFQTTVGIR